MKIKIGNDGFVLPVKFKDGISIVFDDGQKEGYDYSSGVKSFWLTRGQACALKNKIEALLNEK